MSDQIRFEVGGKYENMKGVFEVIAIRRDAMDIRWENGEEISTPIELQQRIIERMQHEKEMEEALNLQKAKKAKAAASKSGKQFAGLESSDFRNTVSKTVWRGRGQLGGAVAKRFKSTTFKFNSWAVLRKPEVQWLDVKRQKQEDLPLQVKFYARVEEKGLFYGLHIPSPKSGSKETTDWHAILAWMEKPENELWLKKQCVLHELCIIDLNGKGFQGALRLVDDQWTHVVSDEDATVIESLTSFLSDAYQTGELSLRVERFIPQDAVIEKKNDIAGDLIALFESLMPMYAATAEPLG
ncbi:MAG: hypothetical protein CSA23_05775 [Deltaproteobacteria bacterium]|nr:MAG: hypothetical protein CSA23_05775 [Deltaproteobacteria bacterium]